MRDYKLVATDKTKQGVQVRMYRRGWKDVRVCLHDKKTQAEWEVQTFGSTKEANAYAKQLINNF
jgi:hypothetical protein